MPLPPLSPTLLTHRSPCPPPPSPINQGNLFSGQIPITLGRLSSPSIIWLNNNRLEGSIPSEFGALTSLILLDLSSNSISSTIPCELFLLTRLSSFLGLAGNPISGTLSPQVGALNELSDLSLGRMQLSGPLPTTLGLMSSLSYLQLGNNRFNSSIPSQLAALTSLSVLDLSTNSLQGELPAMSSLTSITFLGVINNLCLYGPIVSVGQLGTAYDISGTSLGTWSVPDLCGLTLGPAPPPAPPSPPAPPPSPPSPPSPPPSAVRIKAHDLAAMLAIYASWCACGVFSRLSLDNGEGTCPASGAGHDWRKGVFRSARPRHIPLSASHSPPALFQTVYISQQRSPQTRPPHSPLRSPTPSSFSQVSAQSCRAGQVGVR